MAEKEQCRDVTDLTSGENENRNMKSRNRSGCHKDILDKDLDRHPYNRKKVQYNQYVPPEEYYKAQSFKELGKEEECQVVYIQLDSFIGPDWEKEMKHAMQDINDAGPGLTLREIKEKEALDKNNRPLIRVLHCTLPKQRLICSTFGNIKTISEQSDPDYVQVYIGCKYNGNKQATSIHELMHALGFEHEHQRCDGKYVCNYPNPKAVLSMSPEKQELVVQQYLTDDDCYPLTPFDPYSVMFYPEEECMGFCRKDTDIWEARIGDKAENKVLSELDKVGLNLLYRPCRSSFYQPEKSEKNGMYYCQREVMLLHNRPEQSVAEGNKCTEGGPNCPACRTLSKPNGIQSNSQWQGWSGLVYCGNSFTNSNGKTVKCGKHYGESCPNCAKIIRALL